MRTTNTISKTSYTIGRMGNSRNRRLFTAVTGLSLASVLLAGTVFAQQPPPAATDGQAGQPGQPGQGGRAGRGQGGAGRMPFASGTITGGDAGSMTIVINPMNGGAAQTIKVSQSTKFVVQAAVKVSDLKFGDQVQVQGVPSSITASTVTAGDPPDFMVRRGARGVLPSPPGGATGQDANGNPTPLVPQAPPPANASATGKVVSTNPLTIEVNKDISILLKLAPDAKITKFTPTTYNNLKVGDKIMAAGTMGDDGMFAATGVGVNMDMGAGRGGFGAFGGFGGPGGGFGPGGGGGFGPGAGGFGGGGAAGAQGGRGTRRNRGGGGTGNPPDPNNP